MERLDPMYSNCMDKGYEHGDYEAAQPEQCGTRSLHFPPQSLP